MGIPNFHRAGTDCWWNFVLQKNYFSYHLVDSTVNWRRHFSASILHEKSHVQLGLFFAYIIIQKLKNHPFHSSHREEFYLPFEITIVLIILILVGKLVLHLLFVVPDLIKRSFGSHHAVIGILRRSVIVSWDLISLVPTSSRFDISLVLRWLVEGIASTTSMILEITSLLATLMLYVILVLILSWSLTILRSGLIVILSSSLVRPVPILSWILPIWR